MSDREPKNQALSKSRKLIKNIAKRHPGSEYATQVRGLAALAVFGVHAQVLAPILNHPRLGGGLERVITNLANFGSAGPAAFFITSGFVLTLVWERTKKNGFIFYFLRRYIRLMPLYSIALVYFYSSGEFFKDTDQVKDFVLRILFLDTFNERLFLTSPNDILWTISIEFWVSLCIPFFVYVFKETRCGEFFLLACFLISVGSPMVLIHLGVDNSMAHKSLPSTLFCFAVGSYISLQAKSKEAAKTYSLILILGVGFAAMYVWGGYMGQWWVTILITFGYLGKKRTSAERVTNSIPSGMFIWLGTICYGVYLFHPIFIGLLIAKSGDWVFYWALPPVLAASTISWMIVERPLIGMFRSGRSRHKP